MIEIRPPELQIDFYFRLSQARSLHLLHALRATVQSASVRELDAELAKYSDEDSLSVLAGYGLRGETFFATPLLLKLNPRLFGYYRLVLGYSQKECAKSGLGIFRLMETKGKISKGSLDQLDSLCVAFGLAAGQLVQGIRSGPLDPNVTNDLALLTLGSQWRGSKNNDIGVLGITRVFKVIRDILEPKLQSETASTITIVNNSNRKVNVSFAPDPDIVVVESFPNGAELKRIAIEVKGGSDYSNIHNRIGEAEKSHQKARDRGFNEFWTIINVKNLDYTVAKSESPTTNHFFALDEIEKTGTVEFQDFRNRLMSLLGI